MQHKLVAREAAQVLRRTPRSHPARPFVAAWVELLSLHTPDGRGRCSACTPRWRPRQADCPVLTVLYGALHPGRAVLTEQGSR